MQKFHQPPTAPHLLSEIVKDYVATRFHDELRTEWAIALVLRPPSLLILWLIQSTRVSPTMITIGNLILALLMPPIAILVPANVGAQVLVGAALIYGIMDCVDGGLARLRHQTSRLGQYLDAGSDQIYRLSFYGSVGILIERQAAPENWGTHAVALGILAAWLTTFSRLCRVYAELQFPFDDGPTTGGKMAGLVFSLFSGLDWALPLVALALWWASHLTLFVPFVVIFSLLDLATTQLGLISRLLKRPDA